MEIQNSNELRSFKEKVEAYYNAKMDEICGTHTYRELEGFSQEQIYKSAGAKDLVATLILKSGTESARLYGETLTVVFFIQ